MVFLPLSHIYYHDSVIHVRVSGDPFRYAAAVEDAVHELNGDIALFDFTSLERIADRGRAGELIGSTLTSLLGFLALALAAVGLYGVVAYATEQRIHEIGIRMALGARPTAVCSLILGQGLRLTLVGLGIGLVIVLVLAPFLTSRLGGVPTDETLTYAAVASVLCVTAMAACFLPARRAATGNPIIALRHE